MKWETLEERKKYYREWRAKNSDKRAVYAKSYKLKRLKTDPKYIVRTVSNWRKAHPERVKAHRIVFSAIRRGDIYREPCFCGNTKAEAHHNDYSKPLEIVWLCKKHHVEADKNRVIHFSGT